MMYRKKPANKTHMARTKTFEGEAIEVKLRRIVNNKEPITDSAPIIYTERKDGVQPDYNIRTDRWEHAIDGMDKVSKAKKALREERHKTKEGDKETGEKGQEGMKAEGESKA